MKRILKWAVPLLALVLAAGYVWLRVLPPYVERLYAEATERYQSGDYRGAVSDLEKAHRWRPWAVHVNILLGWSYWRLGEAAKAESYFARAHRSDPDSDEAKIGLAHTSLALRHLSTALPLFEELTAKHPSDDELAAGLSQAYLESGRNTDAARVYDAWLRRDPTNQKALKAFLGMYGYPEYKPDLQLAPSAPPRPNEAQIFFRAHGQYLQIRSGSDWQDIYPVGVNLGPARPGEFSSTASRDFSTYATWLQQIAEMNANTVRIYTILPPAFYQALRAHNEQSRSPLWLIQEVWIEDGVQDLYDSEAEQEFRRELRTTIDLLHGNADVRYRRGHSYGIYTADVSKWVLALGVGREVEPRLVLNTNQKHAAQTSYKGQYVSLHQGNPAEAWFARMCDEGAAYEMEKYNAQRPLTVVNWPPLDPMTHSTEANYVEELKIRKRLGEVVPEEIPEVLNDADAVSLDVARFTVEPQFASGLFALFHVYQHWPDFLLHESSYAAAHDSEGPNRYLGYLQELKKAYAGMPLLIGEYGLATSTSSAHVHPQGWNNGGLTEKEQAELLVRFTRNIHDTGCAGGIVFAWQDEWWKHVHDSFTADFERPWERNPFWDNTLDPEKHFGVTGYEPAATVPLLRGEVSDWAGAQQLAFSTGGAGAPGAVRAIFAGSDFAYLYLRLDLTPGAIDWSTTNYWIALNTLPSESGTRQLPGIGVRMETGANFLVQLNGPTAGRILIADDYNPNQPFPVMGRPGLMRIWRKQGMTLGLTNSGRFENIMIEANPARYGRDGTQFPAVNYDRSPLPYGSADHSSAQFSSHAMWNAWPERGLIEVRLPWGLLLMTDPSQLQAFAGTDQQWNVLSRTTPGVSVAAFQVSVTAVNGKERRTAISSLPPLRDNQVAETAPIYTWKPWTDVEYRPFFKQSYQALKQVFGQLAAGGQAGKSSKRP